MLPFAVMPPLMEYLLRIVPDAGHAYAWVSLMTLPALALLAPLGPMHVRHGKREANLSGQASTGLADIGSALKNPGVPLVLGAGLLTFLGSTLLFFFMKDFGASLGMANAGLFFTVSTGATIAVRLFGSARFDRMDKRRTLMLTFLVLAGCYSSYSLVASPLPFLLAAGLFGACMGVAMPPSAIDPLSPGRPVQTWSDRQPHAVHHGCRICPGPYLGGMMLGMGLSHAALFRLSALLALGALLLIRQTGQPSPATLNPSHGRTA